MSYIHGFPPIAGKTARALILGSMPSRASLKAGEYYAHPQNAFWRIMEALFAIDHTLPYTQRCKELIKNNIAVWDVLKTCTRSSSLDSDIDSSSIVTNNFSKFFATHNRIKAIFFNGSMAEKVFIKNVLPDLSEQLSDITMNRLPSTSPAHAALRFDAKLEQWQIIKK